MTTADSTDTTDNDANRKLRDGLLAALALFVGNLAASLADGEISLAEWEDAMREHVKTALGAAYVFGRGGLDQMTDADWEALSGLVIAAYMYLDQFAMDIEASLLSEAAIAARSEMYIGAGVGAYERAQAASMDLFMPVYPGDDCEGRTNCRCAWIYEPQDNGSIEATWSCEDDSESCDPCIAHGEEYNPLFIVVAS